MLGYINKWWYIYVDGENLEVDILTGGNLTFFEAKDFWRKLIISVFFDAKWSYPDFLTQRDHFRIYWRKLIISGFLTQWSFPDFSGYPGPGEARNDLPPVDQLEGVQGPAAVRSNHSGD
jgi:hypothetical protein